MQKNKLIYSTIIFFCTVFHTAGQDMAENPFIRVETDGVTPLYTADPSAHVWADGRLYVYASHDNAPPQGCDLMDGYHVFSTDDMVSWVDHGEILHSRDVPWGRPEGGFMWAPDCAYNPENETYYFYFPHPSESAWNSSWKIGIATSKEPAANFEVQGYLEGIESLIDPCIFVDDDGQPYLYHGGGGRCLGGKLDKNDWAKVERDENGKVKMTEMKGLNDFHEAAWVHKYNGKYYLSHSDNHSPYNRLCYAVSDSPLGPWQAKGVYVGTTDSGTIHGSIVEYKGQWYAFYHNSVLSHNISKGGELRSICVDKLYYNTDGTIKKVIQTGMDFTVGTQSIPGSIEAENFGNDGAGISFYDTTPHNQVGDYRRAGVDIEECSEGGFNVCYTETGEWLQYDVVVNNRTGYIIEARVASENGGAFHFELDGEDITGRVEVPITGGLQKWKSILVQGISLSSSGAKKLKLCIDEGGFNINSFMFFLDREIPAGKSLAFFSQGSYVTLKTGGQLICNKGTASTDNEFFKVEDVGDGTVTLRGANNRYVGAGSPMSCNTLFVNESTKFLWCPLGSSSVALKSITTNKIVCSMAGNSAMTCDRTEIGGWETFNWREKVTESAMDEINAENSRINIFPVPATDFFTVSYTLNVPAVVNIQISDLQGKIIKQIKQESDSGVSSIYFNSDDFTTGLYLLNINSKDFNETKKFAVKQ